jgi:hypothetical protein
VAGWSLILAQWSNVMYEAHPDDKGQWLLYEVGDGGFDLVATFAEKADAEFALQAFMQRSVLPSDVNDSVLF